MKHNLILSVFILLVLTASTAQAFDMTKLKSNFNVPLSVVNIDPAFPAEDSVLVLKFKIDMGTIDYKQVMVMPELISPKNDSLVSCGLYDIKMKVQTKANAALGMRYYLTFKNTAGNPNNWQCFNNLNQMKFKLEKVYVQYPDNSEVLLPLISPSPGTYTYSVGPVQPR